MTVNPNTVPVDTSTTFYVRVPTEKEEPTVRVRVDFPAGLTVSRFAPVPGWTRQVERNQQQLITSVTWSGGQIAPGEYQDFPFIARTPKEAGKLEFKAYQTYQGGETVAWDNPDGSQERPAAVVTVQAPSAAAAKPQADDHSAGAGHTTAAPQVTAAPAAAAAQPVTATASSGSDLPLFIALGGFVLGALALVYR